VVVGTFDRMIDSTEQILRARLRTLPDGVWRHVGFVEHDGVEDNVYAVRLTFTKRDDELTLDFTESSDQAPALINTAEPTTSGYAMAAVMTVLGYGLPWTPAAYWRVMDVRTRPGSIVHAVMPAGMSMGVTSAGQEVRTSVNVCIDRMLDASDNPEHHAQVLASCSSSSATSTISGTFPDGRTFGTMLLDGVTAGMGGRATSDGLDTGGLLTAPAGLCVNVEVSELNYPMRYLWRRERTDSGGPGIHRGGVGADNAYTPHLAGDCFGATMFAHGTEPPTSSGVLGGEPGMQNAFGIGRDGVVTKRKAKEVVVLEPDDVFHNWCAGGGGVGDPLDRSIDEVVRDVEDGLVSVEGARRDYGVIFAGTGFDATLVDADTAAERARRRRARLGGREPDAKLDAPHAGRRLSSGLVANAGTVHCRRCGFSLGDARTNVKSALVLQETSVGYRWPLVDEAPGAARFVFRRFHCPGCATQLDTEVNLAGEPFVHSLEVAP
jgi:N-methylhydantoinase B